MSRFYMLRLASPPSPNGAQSFKVWTSHPNGVYDPGAHNILFDFQVVEYSAYSGSMIVTIEGPALHELIQAAKYSPNQALVGWHLDLYAGMSPHGLPLSTPEAGQPAPGLIAAGDVLESFGNWVGTDMKLSFLVIPSGLSQNPFTFFWGAGQPIADAIANMLNLARPDLTQKIVVNSNLIGPPHGILHTSDSLHGIAHFLKDQTRGPNYGMAPGYPGVSLYIQNGVCVATDFSSPFNANAIKLSEESFIGQPMWIGNDIMAMNLVMRSDIQVGDEVDMPKNFGQTPGFVTTLANINNYAYNFKLAFTGKFIVTAMRHLGEFRGTSGQDWMTVVEAVPEVAGG